MKLTREQRAKVIGGDTSPLFFEDEPNCKKGSTYVLNWARESRSHVGDGQVAVTPAMPTRWLTVTSKERRRDGWLVSFTVIDERGQRRFPRRTPPVYDPKTMKRDQYSAPTPGEIAEARLESNYTTSRHQSADDVYGVDDNDLNRFTQRARDQERKAKEELAGSMRALELALTARLKSLPENSMVDGEIRRARRQVREALAKLDKQLRSLDRMAA